MKYEGKTAVYIKPSLSHGTGPIPVGARGTVLLYSESPYSKKVLVDFGLHSKAIIPLSSVHIEEG